jgi:hypothetical protein
MLYSKNGSIPKPETDGTEGWIEVEDMPVAPEGKEVVWWFPPGWVIRDPQPGPDYSWSQSEQQWVQYVAQTTDIPAIEPLTTTDIAALSTSDLSALMTDQISAL